MNLVQPYYIDQREGARHMSLDGTWEFCCADEAVKSTSELQFEHKTEIPSSVYHSLHKAGILPDPYVGTNSKLYHWVDEKVWYYRKTFTVTCKESFAHAYLCFEGVSYYARLWVNGNLLGNHEGMFGGPVVDIKEYLQEENEIILEVTACNYGKKEGYDFWNAKGENTAIVPWNIVRDTSTSNGDFIVLGLWNRVRLELLSEMHLSRPCLYTDKIENGKARIRFETEISDGTLPECVPYYGRKNECYTYTRAYDTGITGAVRDEAVEITLRICDRKNCVYEQTEAVPLTDFQKLGMDERYFEMQFYRRDIELENPKLWYPNGMGEAFLYDVTVTLSYGGAVLDTHTFPWGIRTFGAKETHGNKYRTRWGKYLFSVNGEDFFLKGMNWIQIDFLYAIDPARYEWCLSMAKNAGIQLIRVWNGGGMFETDDFYRLCDKFGIMVWQDALLANTPSTKSFPQDVLEAQTAYNLYRLRNHPSLVILCGGNEFNPYTEGNAASMFVTQRTVETLTPDRVFYYTTADQGSAHIYLDMEPNWYRHRYSQLPFLGESGIHSFPKFKTLQKFIRKEETEGVLPDLSAPEFSENYPELLNHFSEYIPERVPRMTARISQITDMKSVTLEELCEASQVQVYEYYQMMAEAMQENFPRCGGVMPWVFKRPWVTAGVQTVDGDDRPGYAYYAVQNAYRPVHVTWCQQWSVLAPNEAIPLTVKIFNQNHEDLSDCMLRLTVYNPDLTVHKEYESAYCAEKDFGVFLPDDRFTDTCFLVCAELTRENDIVARSVYFNKCTSVLSDKTLYHAYRTEEKENLRLPDGPWLKHSVCNGKQAKLTACVKDRGFDGTYHYADVTLRNISDVPAYPVTLDVCGNEKRCFLSDNFFLVKPGEEKTVRLTCDSGKADGIEVAFWNGEHIRLS